MVEAGGFVQELHPLREHRREPPRVVAAIGLAEGYIPSGDEVSGAAAWKILALALSNYALEFAPYSSRRCNNVARDGSGSSFTV